MDHFNSTNSRISRTFHNTGPLLNLILAASILTKLTQGKSYIHGHTPWVPFRTIVGYYPQPLWYPVEPIIYPTRFQIPNPQPTTPQMQTPPLHQQQIINIHEASSPSAQDNTYVEQPIYEEQKIEEEYPQIDFVPAGSKQIESGDQMETAATEMEQKIKIMITRNESLPIIVSWIINKLEQNSTLNEIPEPDNLFGKESSTDNVLTTIHDQRVAESHVEYQIAQATSNRRKQRPQNFDYDYEDDYAAVNQKRKPRPTPASRRTEKPYRPGSIPRINSKRGQYRPLTTRDPYYDDEYDITTPRSNRRKPTPRRTPSRRRATPSFYEFDEYIERPNRRKINKNGIRRTTPAYDEYYGNEEELYEADEEGEYMFSRQKATIRPRQQETTSTTTESTSTDTSTTETPTPTPTPTPATVPIVTSGYPYPGNNFHNNVSITYGPPPNQHPGYGPSNGNEHISITYGPSTGSQVGPLLDSWYNQYAKSSVIRRIQDLLTPSNYYSQQYDIDKYNYNDSVF